MAIEKQSLIDALKRYHDCAFTTGVYEHSIVGQAAVLLENSVEVVHGRWEWLGPNRLIPECMCGTCSACKVRSKYIMNTDICPNCGADMRERENNDK